jgi:hypothetical protein
MDWCAAQADTATAFGKPEQASRPVARRNRSWLRESPALDKHRKISNRLLGPQFSFQPAAKSAARRRIALDEQRIAVAKNIWRRE